MRLSYTLDENDFLEFNLYTASKSDSFNKKMRRGMIFLLVMILIMSIYLIAYKHYEWLFYPAALIVVVLFFYKKYYKWRLKKSYLKYIQSNHKDQLKKEEILELKPKSVYVKNQLGEGSIGYKDVVRLTEIEHHMMLLLQSGTSIVVPKKEISDLAAFKSFFTDKNIQVIEELDWKW